MANFSAAEVKRVRDLSGAGFVDCKNALTEADGNIDQALELLRKKGVKDAGKRADRTAANGLVIAELDGTSAGVLVELNCETDFVAKNDGFQELAAKIAAAALASKPADRLALLTTETADGKTVESLIEEASTTIKEKLELGRYAVLQGGYVATYLHRSDRDLPPTIGVLVQLDGDNEAVAKEIAQQIAATSAQYVTRDEVPADVVEKERRIAEEITREEGKPEQAIPRIVEGRLGAFFKDVVLTEQASVKDPKQTVKSVLAAGKVNVKAFARFRVGQA
ncbi:MAG TPA: translation elongation factor Ts [Trebonia sp.]|nr:translation elongation factor Ts [Trebonia sp.]